MNKVGLTNLNTNRLELRIPTINEQHRLWEILINENVNALYFPTPDRIFNKYNLNRTNIEDLKKAREIFTEQLSDWERQEPFYKQKIDSIMNEDDVNRFTWSIFLKGTDIVIGQITCQPKDDMPEDIRDVGWYIDPNYQGQGFATEAAEAVLDYMFNVVDILEIQTSAASINPASWKIMERLGFKYIGEKPSTYFSGDEILNVKEYYGNKELFLNRPKKNRS